MSDIHSDAEELLAEAPRPTPGFAEQGRAHKESREAEWDRLRDAQGRAFDPSLHETDSSGEPVLTNRGKLRMKRGRKSGDRSEVPPTSQTLNDRPHAVNSDPEHDFRALARLTVDNLVGGLQMLLGPDWAPVVEPGGFDERAGLIDAWTGYYRHKGITEVNPLVMVAIASAGFALAPSPVQYGAHKVPRVAAPNTQARIAFVLSQVFPAKPKGKVSNGARPDPGSDRVRKDDAGETPSRGMH